MQRRPDGVSVQRRTNELACPKRTSSPAGPDRRSSAVHPPSCRRPARSQLLWKKSHTLGTNSTSAADPPATALRAVAGDSPRTCPAVVRTTTRRKSSSFRRGRSRTFADCFALAFEVDDDVRDRDGEALTRLLDDAADRKSTSLNSS